MCKFDSVPLLLAETSGFVFTSTANSENIFCLVIFRDVLQIC